MPNTSATGGYLSPETTPAPTEGTGLEDALQALFAGVTGLAGSLVRPRFQLEPPPQPSIATNWLAFGVTAIRPDDDAYQEQLDAGRMRLIRHEQLELLCTFYGPAGQAYLTRLRDGLEVAQNREALYLLGIGLVRFSDPVRVPELANERWLERWDVNLTLRREVRREYPVLHFLGARGTIEANRAEETLVQDWQAGVEYVEPVEP